MEEHLNQAAERFWEAVPTVWDRVRDNLRGTATSQFNITVEQFRILRHIRHGNATVGQLATARQISRSAVSQSVELLVKKGYVCRQERIEDRRYVRLELTNKGTGLLNTAYSENRKWIMSRLSTLTPDETDHMLQGLELMKKAFL
ncbi:MAG TPA: MarR family transcriptional regulator [Anaerolineales bacterium]|nr:MarR family transcriptional regulator [Anaerolineales bacterium]